MIKIFFITILQGILEAFPVSSSMHLNLLGQIDQSLINIMHLGSFLAFLTITWPFIFKIVIQNFIAQNFISKNFIAKHFIPAFILSSKKTNNQKFNLNIVSKLSILPLGTLIIGFVIVKYGMPNMLSNNTFLFNIAAACMMLISEFFPRKNSLISLTHTQCCLISIILSLSLISGISRMGITYTTFRLFKLRPFDSLFLTLLIGIPITASVGLLELVKNPNLPNFIYSLIAGLITFFSLKITFHVLDFWWAFSIYRILFSTFCLISCLK